MQLWDHRNRKSRKSENRRAQMLEDEQGQAIIDRVVGTPELGRAR
jgi:hypothetical protein